METNFRTTRDLVGKYLQCSWNGMSDFYKVVGYSYKSVVVQEVNWVVVEAENPTSMIAKIDFINNEPNFIKKPHRCMVDKTADGYIKIKKSPNYDGCASVKICALNDEEAKRVRVSQYWG